MKFQNVKVGDKLWSIQLGDCVVIRISRYGDTTERIDCVDLNREIRRSYTFDGRCHTAEKMPSLFFSKPEIIEPKRKVTKTVDVWVNVAFDLSVRAYSDKDELANYIDETDMVKKAKGTLTYETEE